MECNSETKLISVYIARHLLYVKETNLLNYTILFIEIFKIVAVSLENDTCKIASWELNEKSEKFIRHC